MAYDHRRDLNRGNWVLPDGVPASNQEAPDGRASFSASAFKAPDMATPRFAQKRKPAQGAEQGSEHASGVGLAATRRPLQSLDPAQAVDGAPPRRTWLSPGQTILFAAILILLGALGVSVILSGGGLPLCADQPQWNQYNCRAY